MRPNYNCREIKKKEGIVEFIVAEKTKIEYKIDKNKIKQRTSF